MSKKKYIYLKSYFIGWKCQHNILWKFQVFTAIWIILKRKSILSNTFFCVKIPVIPDLFLKMGVRYSEFLTHWVIMKMSLTPRNRTLLRGVCKDCIYVI